MDAINKFLLGFVIVILGAVLVTVIAGQVLLNTEKNLILNESHTITPIATLGNAWNINESELETVTNYPAGWKETDCPLTSFVLKNQSGGTLTLNTDYVLYAINGTYRLLNTTATVDMINNTATNVSRADYVYCADDYLNSQWGRNVLLLSPGLFAVMILVAIIALVYAFLRFRER